MDPQAVPGCTGKRAFGKFCQARTAADRMRRQHEDGCKVEAYRCRHCGMFHVGQKFDLRGSPARSIRQRDARRLR